MAGIVGVSLDVLEVNIGAASTFRSNINTNFDRVKDAIDKLDDNDTYLNGEITTFKSKGQIVIGTSEPSVKNTKDIWLQIT